MSELLLILKDKVKFALKVSDFEDEDDFKRI
jgi:transportin-1